MAIEVYLNFDGNCRQAVEYYAKVFGGEAPKIMTFGEAPPNPDHPLPEEAKNLVMHAQLNIGGSNVMFSDCFPGMTLIQGNNVSLTFISKDMDEIKSAFNHLSDGGKVGMELQETFWSKLYGSCRDRFGIEWQFSHDSGEFHM